jgi:hypothetical protein
VIDLLTMPHVRVGLTVESARSAAPSFELTDEDDRLLACAAVRPLSAWKRLRRSLSTRARFGFVIDLRDPHDGLVLTITKARDSILRGPLRVSAALADGTPVGTARQRAPFAHLRLCDAAGAVLAEATRTLPSGFDLARPDGAVVATVDVRTVGVRQALAGGAYLRGYSLRFGAGTPVSVRALTLGAVLCRDVQLRPSGAR